MSPSPAPHRPRDEKPLAGVREGRDAEGLISSQLLPRAMDTQDILDAALRLAKQSEIPSDTTINVPAKNVRRALFGIDVEAADLLMAKEKGYDVVIAHHPTGGSAALDFPKVLVKHADILVTHGVPRPVADAAIREMQEDREQRAHAENYDRLPSIARLIGIGLMCIHNPCDEIGRRVMDETLRAKVKPSPRVRDAIDTLYTIPEFQAAKTRIAVRMGKIDNSLGKWRSTTARGRTEGYPSPERPSSTASTRFSISTSMRGPSDGCGSSSGARVRRTLWSRGTWLRTASASTRSSESSGRVGFASTLTAELSMSEHYYYHNAA